MQTNQQVILSHKQAQYLLTRLSLVAAEEQGVRKAMRNMEGALWARSDKSDEETEAYFKSLNHVRNGIRESKKEEAKLNKIIQQLRKVQ